jgi:hypothetical protein
MNNYYSYESPSLPTISNSSNSCIKHRFIHLTEGVVDLLCSKKGPVGFKLRGEPNAVRKSLRDLMLTVREL